MGRDRIAVSGIVRNVFLVIAVLLAVSCGDAPSRDVPTGRLHLAFADAKRSNWSGDGPRPLAATVWYPASPEASEEEWSAGVFRFGHGALEVPFVDAAERPLVVLSHGTGGSAAQLSWLAERLAPAGFIVAGVNHHGNTAVEDRQWPGGFVLPWERTRDLSVLIDRLLAHPEIGPRIDRRRIGAAGFSLGGYSVLGLAGIQLPSFEAWERRCGSRPDSPACRLPPEARFTLDEVDSMKRSDPAFQSGIERGRRSVRDSRVTAVYAIAPALISLLTEAEVPGDVSAALRVVLSENDEQVALSETRSFLTESLPQASVRVVEDGTHYVFLSECTLRGRLMLRSLCSDPWGVDRNDVHAMTGQDAVDFFDSALRR